jgi:hypothetical protein
MINLFNQPDPRTLAPFVNITVYFADGDYLHTQIRGSRQEIEAYYVGHEFELREGYTTKAIRVEFR